MQFTFVELWQHMGGVAKAILLVLVVMSLASLLVMFERWFSFGRARRDSIAFALRVASGLQKGDLSGARTLAEGTPKGREGYLGRVIQAGLAAHGKQMDRSRDLRFEAVLRALERQSQRELQDLRRGLGLLASVCSAAPFIGLLGTVVGIVNAFQQMALSGAGGLATVSAGISEALVTTAVGLFVAIPALLGFNHLQGWVEARTVDLAEACNELADEVARADEKV